MKVPVGPHLYRVILVDGFVIVDGQELLGCCDSNRQVIKVSNVPLFTKRMSVFFHEFGHAWKDELDITDSPLLDEESICNLIGLAMSKFDPQLMGRLYVYLKHGIDADAVRITNEIDEPIPVINYTV